MQQGIKMLKRQWRHVTNCGTLDFLHYSTNWCHTAASTTILVEIETEMKMCTSEMGSKTCVRHVAPRARPASGVLHVSGNSDNLESSAGRGRTNITVDSGSRSALSWGWRSEHGGLLIDRGS